MNLAIHAIEPVEICLAMESVRGRREGCAADQMSCLASAVSEIKNRLDRR
jgi:hypothetical protein